MTPRYPKPPQNVIDFARRFPDEASCARYLFELRYPEGYACSKCGSKKAWPVAEKPGMMICENNHKVSVTAGTAMHRTKIPLTVWFHAAWLVATMKPGISAVQFQRQLGMSRLETAWMLLHKLRDSLFAPDRDKLTSTCTDPTHTDHWIEVDEVYVGGKEEGEGRRGRGAQTKALVVVAVEVHQWDAEADTKRRSRKGIQAFQTKAGRARMKVIPDAKGVTLDAFIRDNIVEGSAISTDAHLGYRKSEQLYPRRITVAKASSDPLPTLGRVTTNLKRWLIGTHKGAVQSQHLQSYLNEYVFRFNRRDIPWISFNRALGLAALTRPALEYEGLQSGRQKAKNPIPLKEPYSEL